MSPVLEVTNLETHFFTRSGVIRAVNRVSFSVDKGNTLAIVGESGCGKSVTALSILGTKTFPGGQPTGVALSFSTSSAYRILTGASTITRTAYREGCANA